MTSDIIGTVAPENIDMLTKIIEAYEHIGIVSTLDNQTGRIIIRGTEDTVAELKIILANLPFAFEIVE
ncbi:MAG TPA: DUF4911 domain-containing protein [Syntrophomonadaceae bacterium]|jgi:phosphoribosylformimino-5-aminoimidazole carboxamide ribonucleotide (ProFAR) isomerase|nr:DUF4911 domain-containing protein [Syntrophomonadaceae bacterium]HRX21268.1 DUF4911 domain-containing protein [Syntrophomonadaceae bacterium]